MRDHLLQKAILGALREAETGALAGIGLRGNDRARASTRARREARERRLRAIMRRVQQEPEVTPEELEASVEWCTKTHTS